MTRSYNKGCLLSMLVIMLLFCSGSFGQRRIWLLELSGEVNYKQKVYSSGNKLTDVTGVGGSVRLFHNSKFAGYGIEFQHQGIKSKQFTKPARFELWDFYFHLRYYPLIPPARIGRAAGFRVFSGVGLGGYSFYWREQTVYETNELRWNPFQFDGIVYAGLAITPLRSMKGATLKLNYRPQANSCLDCAGYQIEVQRTFSLSAGIQIGPSLNK